MKSLFQVGTYFLFSMVFVVSGSVRYHLIRIQGNDTDPADPDPQHWVGVEGMYL